MQAITRILLSSIITCLYLNAISSNYVRAKDKIPLPAKIIKRVVVKQVDFNIATYASTSCFDFENQFPIVKITNILNKNRISEIDKELHLLSKDRNNAGTNVRAKAIIYYNDNTSDELCISYYNMELRGKKLELRKRLIDLLGIHIAL